MAIFLYMAQVGSQKYIRRLIFFFSYFNNQIWLNQIMHDCHLSYITKLEKKTLFYTWFFDLEFFAWKKHIILLVRGKIVLYV
jgi:hypothetical protein